MCEYTRVHGRVLESINVREWVGIVRSYQDYPRGGGGQDCVCVRGDSEGDTYPRSSISSASMVSEHTRP